MSDQPGGFPSGPALGAKPQRDEPADSEVFAAILEWNRGTWLEGCINGESRMREALRAAYEARRTRGAR